ncbi:flagellar hook-associated protein FlgK [Alicyclobacillus curvatus]|nr:flagellar hook-associated protein FlgK [Alicyclobacillus curvatus]
MAGFGTFFGLNTGVSALQTAQQALSVISNNIANASTPGYTLETANISEATPFPPLPSSAAPIVAGQVGEGSTVSSVTRQVSLYYNTLVQQNQTNYNGQNTLLNNLNEIQGVIGEPTTTSIHSAIDTFFTSWQNLATTQADSKAARQTVIQQAVNLSDTFSTVQNQLVSIVSGLDNSISDPNAGQVAQVNQYASQLNDLNKQIVAITHGGQNPNQLLDQRDTILNNLAKLGNLSYTQNADGSRSVNFGTVNIVSASSGTYSTTAFTNADAQQLTSGGIWANLQGINTAQNVIQQLGTLQGAIADSVNAQLQKGYQLNSALPGTNLFNVTTSNVTTASGNVTTPVESMSVVAGFTTDQLAAAQTANAPADGSNAAAIAALQNSTALSDTTPTTPVKLGATPDDYYTSIVSGIGAQTSAVQSRQKTANSLLQQAQTMQQSVSGVNQNDEMAQMIQFQNMYTAASKFISVEDQMLQNLIQAV